MFKYKIEVTGSDSNIVKFAKELLSLGYGYSYSGDYNPDKTKIESEYSADFEASKLTTNNVGFYLYVDTYDPNEEDHTGEYKFNIDKENEYNAALAIASRREDDNIPFVGEWAYCLDDHKSSKLKEGQIGRIGKTPKEKKSDVFSFDNFVSSYVSYFETNLNGRYTRKATAEEILTHFKINNMKKEEQVITGYKLLKDLPRLKAGAIVQKGVGVDKSDWYGNDLNIWQFEKQDVEDTEWFEAIYENEVKTKEFTVEYNWDGSIWLDSFTVKVSSEGTISIVDIDDEEGTTFEYEDLKRVLGVLSNLKGSKWDLSVTLIDIGCKSDVSVEDLQALMKVYERLNGIK